MYLKNYLMKNNTDFPIAPISKLGEKESWRKELNRPIYHIHKWWAQRLGSVFRALILYLDRVKSENIWDSFYHFHNKKDIVVLDPFMGSGTTIGEALKLGAKAVGCDINPISSFLVKQELTKVQETTLLSEYNKLEKAVAKEIKDYYVTVNPSTGNLIPVLYYFWVKEITLPNGEVVPLFDRYVFAQNAYPSKKPEATIYCPHCGNVFRGRYNDSDVSCPRCNHSFNPQDGPASRTTVRDSHGNVFKIKDVYDGTTPLRERMYALLAINEDGGKVYLPIQQFDIELYNKAISELNKEPEPVLPFYTVKPGYNTDQARGYGYHEWKQFFNSRQLLCLNRLLKKILCIGDRPIQEQFLCLFSSILEYNNMFCSYKGEGTGAVRPIFSNHILKPERTPIENSIWGTKYSSGCFSSLFKSKLLPAKRYLDAPFELSLTEGNTGEKYVASPALNPTIVKDWEELSATDNSVLILNGDSSSLPIPDASVDYVVTDPPYFDFIHYSELSDFFYAWLSPILSQRYPFFIPSTSRRDNEVQQTDASLFSCLLGNVYKECFRVTKPGGKLAFSFHHSRIDGWGAIAHAIIKSGFFVDEVFPVHAELMASTTKAGTKEPISIDAMFVCSKEYHDEQESLIVDRINSYLASFSLMGKALSSADIFVICASQCTIKAVNERMDIAGLEELINSICDSIHQQGSES